MGERGTAEANWISGKCWWVARVLVQPASERRKGIGSRMLKLLMDQVRASGAELLQVSPGSYDSDPWVIKFYEKNGFVQNPQEPDLYEAHLS